MRFASSVMKVRIITVRDSLFSIRDCTTQTNGSIQKMDDRRHHIEHNQTAVHIQNISQTQPPCHPPSYHHQFNHRKRINISITYKSKDENKHSRTNESNPPQHNGRLPHLPPTQHPRIMGASFHIHWRVRWSRWEGHG